MFTIRRISVAAMFLLFAASPRTLFSQTAYTYRQIDFPGAGFPGTVATGINDAGEIVGYYYGAHSYFHGFTWINGVFTAVGFPDPQIQSSVDAINNCGSRVGHIVYNGNPDYPMYQSFLVTGGKFALLDYPGAVSTLAGGINNYGVISGTYDVTGYTGFLLSQGEFRTPPNLPPYPMGINDLGDEVGYYCPGNPTCYGSGTFTGFLYNQRTQTVFPIPFPGNEIPTIATGINNLGEIVGYYYPPVGNPQGFLYSNGAFTTIAVPGASGTLPNSINNAGVIAGSFGGPTGIQRGFIATPETHAAAPPAPESGCSQ